MSLYWIWATLSLMQITFNNYPPQLNLRSGAQAVVDQGKPKNNLNILCQQGVGESHSPEHILTAADVGWPSPHTLQGCYVFWKLLILESKHFTATNLPSKSQFCMRIWISRAAGSEFLHECVVSLWGSLTCTGTYDNNNNRVTDHTCSAAFTQTHMTTTTTQIRPTSNSHRYTQDTDPIFRDSNPVGH